MKILGVPVVETPAELETDKTGRIIAILSPKMRQRVIITTDPDNPQQLVARLIDKPYLIFEDEQTEPAE